MATAARLPYTRTESTANLARRLFDDNNGDEQATIAAITARAARNPSLASELILMAATSLVGQIHRAANQDVYHGGGTREPVVTNGPMLRTVDKVNVRGIQQAKIRAERSAISLAGLFSFKLKWNGKSVPLGLARREDIAPLLGHYETQGADMVRKGRWLRRIIDSLPDDQSAVSEVLTEKQVRAMRDFAKKSPV